MATIAENLEQLAADKQAIADNLTAMGAEAATSDSMAALAAKILDIPSLKMYIGEVTLDSDSATLTIQDDNIDFVPSGIAFFVCNTGDSTNSVTGSRTVSGYFDADTSILNSVYAILGSVYWEPIHTTGTAEFALGSVTVNTGYTGSSDTSSYKFRKGTWRYIVWR